MPSPFEFSGGGGGGGISAPEVEAAILAAIDELYGSNGIGMTEAEVQAMIDTAISNLVNGASTLLDTLGEIGDILGDPTGFVGTVIGILEGLGALSTLDTVGTSQIDNQAVTLGKLVNASAQFNILMRTSSDAGSFEQRTLSSDVSAALGAANDEALRTEIGLGSGNSPQFTGIELGHASDTTISRAAAGVLAVEGGVIPKENRVNTFSQRQEIRVNGATTANSQHDDLVVGNEGGNGGLTILSGTADTGGIAFGNTSDNFIAWLRYDHATSDMNIGANNVTRLYWDDSDVEWEITGDLIASAPGGVVFGSPTGGKKGAGTLNAKGVYDDNTLLTCYVFDAALDGAVDLEKWDGLVPDWVTPEEWAEVQTGVRQVEVGREIVDGVERPVYVDEPVLERVKIAEAKVEERAHDGARRFAARLGTAHAPLTLDGYAAHWQEKRHLTSMPNEATFDPQVGLPTGAWIQRLVETVEIQAVLIEQLNLRLKVLEADNQALESNAFN